MDRVYKRSELEVKMFGRWTELPSDCEYRIKPEVVHYAYADGCRNEWEKHDTVTNDRSKVTCPDCLAKMCKYPGLRQAIQERKEFYVKVTPEQSREVQEIAFACGVEWIGTGKIVMSYNSISFCHSCDKIYMTTENKNTEFHLSTDSFTAPLPDWVKVGAKCFTFSDALVEITGLIDNDRVEVIYSENNKSSRKINALTPAVRHAPTYEELAKKMPFAVSVKGKKITISVDRVDDERVFVGDGGFCYFQDLHEKYTFADGSEIGE